MHKTQFYGLTELDPGDPSTVDGASFSQQNPSHIDAVLRVGAVTHRHDAHLPLPDPVGRASASVVASGGQIPAGTTIVVAYTLTDSDLGETRRSAPAQVVTPAAPNGPQSPIVAAFDATGGTLPVGQYVYALTLNDAGGGETTLGPAAFVTRSPGYASGQVQLSGLDTEIGGSTPYVSWNLWRMQDGSQFQIMLAGGTDDVFTDTGLVCTDAARQPPTDMSSILSTSLLTVTLPDDTQDASVTDAITFRLYFSEDGSFANPCFYAAYPVASAGVAIDIPLLALQQGAPPPVSLASVGASKIDPDTDMLDFPWRRPVATVADLPPTGNEDGDVRLVIGEMTLYGWSGTDWEPLLGSGGGASPVTISPSSVPTGEAFGTPTVGAPASGAFVHDTFTDADDTLLTAHVGEVGATWAMHVNSSDPNPGIITSDQYRRGDAHIAENRQISSGVPPSPDYTITADYVKVGAADTNAGYVDLWARLDSAATTGYMLRYNTNPGAGPSVFQLYSVVAGAFTLLGAYAVDVPFTATLSVIGTAIKVTIGGVDVMSYVDAAVAAAGFVGIGGAAGSSGDATDGVWLDNLTAQ